MPATMSGREVAQQLADFANHASKSNISEFVDELVNRTHRTLQQRVMSFFLELVKYYATLKPSQYDVRNEATVRLSERIVESFDEYDLRLPLI